MTEAQKKVYEENRKKWVDQGFRHAKKNYISMGLIEVRYEGLKHLTEMYVCGNHFTTLASSDKGYVNDKLWIAAMRAAEFMSKGKAS